MYNINSLEQDYSLCFDEQFTVQPKCNPENPQKITNFLKNDKNGLTKDENQNPSILTSICLTEPNDLESDLSMDKNNKKEQGLYINTPQVVPYDSALMDSEFFFQESENENDNTSDFNFTKISDLVDDPNIFADTSKKNEFISRSKSNQTLDGAYDKTISSSRDDFKAERENVTNNGEVETVKHKLTNLWNNVKYGWVSYLKKPNKISLENGPIYILGKKFNSNNSYERTTTDFVNNYNNNGSLGSSTNNYTKTNSNNGSYKPDSLPFDFIDANKLNSLNESYICPSMPIQVKQNTLKDDENLYMKQNASINSNEFLSVGTSLEKSQLSTSPFSSSQLKNFTNYPIKNKTDYCIVDGLSYNAAEPNKLLTIDHKNKANGNNNPGKSVLSDYMQLQHLDLQKTSLEQEIQSRLWFTYRKDFEPLNGNLKYTSDCGWGCMLRSAQMLIGQGLLVHFFGKEWSLYNKFKNYEYNVYKEIISLFNDRSSKNCPFGIHRLLEIADHKKIGNPNFESSKNGKILNPNDFSRVGSWFGPSSVCLLMKEALIQSSSPLLNQTRIKIYVAQDCTVYKKDVIDMCMGKTETESDFKPCLILISVRLGGEELNEIYIPSLKLFFEMDMCIGMIGGKPKHSLYFMGYQGEKVIYLDPHLAQPTENIYATTKTSINDHSILSTSSNSSLSSSKHSYDDTSSSDYEIFDNSTFHCENPSKTLFSKLDPSFALGFLCSSLNDLNKLCDLVKKISASDKIFPIFGVTDESFEKSQSKYQMLIDEDSLPETVVSSISPILNKKSAAIPISSPNKTRTNTHVKSHPQYKTLPSKTNKNLQSLPMKFDNLHFEKVEKIEKKYGSKSPKKLTSSYLTDKFTRQKQSKKKSESDDFVLV